MGIPKMTVLQERVVATLEAMAEEQGYTSTRSWYDHDGLTFRLQLGISEVAFMERLDSARRMPQLPVSELVRKILLHQIGKGLRRYGRRK